MRLSALKPSLMAGMCRSRGLPTGQPGVLALAVMVRDLEISFAWTLVSAPPRSFVTYLFGAAPWRAR